jgi:hypothetical protein
MTRFREHQSANKPILQLSLARHTPRDNARQDNKAMITRRLALCRVVISDNVLQISHHRKSLVSVMGTDFATKLSFLILYI